ncbi:S-layer homology domain-containing protein [Phosphitispora sp. TUW77]|uniref:S-layer homology domain-containing protein n=1 Tax=Phosphitispora sp. TUW77 TaxID=3152361 RepID=UPI003AB843EC
MRNKARYLILLPVLLGFIAAQAVSAGSGPPGSSSNPVVTKSYANEALKPVQERVYALHDELDSLRGKASELRIALDRLNEPVFSDVPVEHWASGDIRYMVNRGIINGMGDGTFAPGSSARRCEVAAMLVKALDLPVAGAEANFKDVSPGHWAYGYIAAAQKAGIISGFPSGEFKPDNNVTRAQMAIMLSRAYGLEKSGATAGFQDVRADYWAYDAILSLADNGISRGYPDGTFRPVISVSRAEVAALLAKAMDPVRRIKQDLSE